MQQGSVHDDVIESRAVGRPMLIKVILPPGYQPDADTPYPVLYFLHPWGLSPRYLTDKLRIQQHLWDGIARGALPPMIVALPTGERSFYLNAADPSGQDWSDVMNRAKSRAASLASGATYTRIARASGSTRSPSA